MRARFATAASPCARTSSAIAWRSLRRPGRARGPAGRPAGGRASGARALSAQRLPGRSRPSRSPMLCARRSSAVRAGSPAGRSACSHNCARWALLQPGQLLLLLQPAEQLDAVVAEVTSTPWGERHAYVLERDDDGRVLGASHAKRLHVSPFMGMEQSYRWRVAAPAATLSVHIESLEAERARLRCDALAARAPLTRQGLAAMTVRYPAATLRVLASDLRPRARTEAEGRAGPCPSAGSRA